MRMSAALTRPSEPSFFRASISAGTVVGPILISVSAAAAAHFANPRNDFWRLLHAARLTSRLYQPHEQFALLDEGIGVLVGIASLLLANTVTGAASMFRRRLLRHVLEAIPRRPLARQEALEPATLPARHDDGALAIDPV